MAQVKWLKVSSEDAGQRLDNFLVRELKGAPKTLVYRIIRKGEVRVNKGRSQASRRLEAGDEVRVPPIFLAEKQSAIKPSAPLIDRVERAIIFEDKDLIVINKPAGMAVHGGSGVSLGLIEIVRQARPLARRVELVHRLDKDTSGVMVLAKKTSVLRDLHEQIREDKLLKKYLTLVVGSWPQKLTKVDLPLLRTETKAGDRKVVVSPAGKPSLSKFKIIESSADLSLLEVQLITGRTHQIRVHTQASGHPILGDSRYGDFELNRKWQAKFMFLHASTLGFTHPASGDWVEFNAPLYGGFKNFLQKMDWKYEL